MIDARRDAMSAPSDARTDWIGLDALKFDAIIGINEDEQHRPQPLDLNLRFALTIDALRTSADLSRSINYAAVAKQARFIGQHGRWLLIESLALAVCALVLLPPAVGERRAGASHAVVRVRKPLALKGKAVPWVEVAREAAWAERAASEPCDAHGALVGVPATLDVLAHCPTSAAYRLHLPPLGRWALPADLAAMAIAGAGSAGARVITPGSVLSRGTAAATALRAADGDGLTLLLVGAPLGAARSRSRL